MPYNLPFERINELSNESAFEQNKRIAIEIIASFSEFHDSNQVDSSGHFILRELDFEDEFPDKHFSLHAEIEDMWFGLEFWKDVLWLDLGAGGNVDIRFARVRRYAAFITRQGFKINPFPAAEIATLDEGLAWHLQEYKKWRGFVDHVANLINTKP